MPRPRRQSDFINGLLFIGLVCALGTAPVMGGEGSLPRNHPKYRTTAQVFDRLVQAIGDGRTPPTLRLVTRDASSPMQVAWFDGDRRTVAIDERVYDLFVAMGPDSLDALAWLLGHELAHYYQDHGWAGDFGNGFADLDVGRKMKALSNQRSKAIEIETQADYFGAFYGQVAGYRTLDVMPAALQRVYTEYELDPELTGYPALGERQEIARGAADQLRLLIPVFEVGNNMLLLGLYEEAGRCFDMIAEFFPSREILNNAGVARALEALELLEDEELLRFAYPLELDVDTRLRQVGGKAEEAGYEEGDYERRERLLREAQAIFEQARERDDSYVPAIVNLACVLDLRGEHEDAGYWARKAMRVARDQQDAAGLAHALIVRGISAAHLSPADTAAARNDFVAASDAAAPMAAYNLAALDGKAVAAETTAKRRPAEPETIAGLGADDYRTLVETPDVRTRVPPGGWGQPAMTVYARRTERWEGLLVDTGYRTVVLYSTLAGQDDRSRLGVVPGTELARVEQLYGPATHRVNGRGELYLRYDSPYIVFRVDEGGHVEGWMIYAIK